jgi:hypothetical protein
MEALVQGLELRGFTVRYEITDTDEGGYRRSRGGAGEAGRFVVAKDAHELRLVLSEQGVGSRGLWEAHRRRREEQRGALRFDPWDVGRIEPFDKDATGQLDLTIVSSASSRRSKWGDRKRWSLEDRLPQVARELEVLVDEAKQHQIERERSEAERQRSWETAMESARQAATNAHYVAVLDRRLSAWTQAEHVRAYCDAVEQRHDVAATADPATVEWLSFARQHADALQNLPRMPPKPELRPEDLKPYLRGWSPYGPRSTW